MNKRNIEVIDSQKEVYRNGIIEAEGAGQISFWKKGRAVQNRGRKDIYDPELGLRERSRALEEAAKPLLGIYARGNVTRVLMLGPGTGMECYEAQQVAPDRIVIDTASLSPFNPTKRLTMRYSQVKDRLEAIAEALRQRRDAGQLAEKYPVLRDIMQPKHRRFVDSGLPNTFDELLDFQRALEAEGIPCDKFVEDCNPYVRHQFIGKFPEDVRLEEATYDLLYDSHAAYLHGTPTLRDGLRLLTPQGTMLISTWSRQHESEAQELMKDPQ